MIVVVADPRHREAIAGETGEPAVAQAVGRAGLARHGEIR